jgi:hypothetical protein
VTNPLPRASWTSATIIIGMPTLLCIIAWLIALLSNPVKWCSVRVADTKLATSTISDCTSIVLALIHWLGWTCMGLVLCVIVAFLVIVTRDLKAGLDVRGPGGFSVHTGGDAVDAANKVADAAVGAAGEVAAETDATAAAVTGGTA